MTYGESYAMTLQMGIIKIEVKIPELVKAIDSFKQNRLHALQEISNEIKSSIANTFEQLLQTEMDIFLGGPDQADNKRNGYYEREYALKGIGCIRVRAPRDRKQRFVSEVLPKHEVIDPRLKDDLAILHLAGISNRTLAMISRRVLGVNVSTNTVHESLGMLEDKALAWLDRKIENKYWALFIDGTNFRIQRRGSTEKEPTLVVLGLDDRNTYSILSMQPGQKDSSECWESVFSDLIKRGLDPSKVEIGIMDGLPGLETKFKEYFTKAVTGRCWVHSKRNALSKVPKRLAIAFSTLLDRSMYANNEEAAREAFKHLKIQVGADAERAIKSIEKDLDSLMAHYRFEKALWRTLRTTNPIERINKELKRRTKIMEGLGEKTLTVMLVFIAMRLEYNWQKIPVDSRRIQNLKYQNKKNEIEHALENLMH